MRTLLVGDIHLNERYIEEIDSIFEKDIFPITADRLIQLGDFFDRNSPSPLEEKYGSELILKMKQHYKEVIILAGNGEHEYIRGTGIVEHLQSLGIKIIKGDLIEDKILYGHWMVAESRLSFGQFKYKKSELSKYETVFLGHQHTFQIIAPNIIHLGSIRYVTFNEVGIPKSIVSLEDGKPEYIPLKNTIDMVDVTNVSQLEHINPNTKVRVIFNSFEDYKKNASYVNKIGRKFFLFKIKMNFEQSKIIDMGSKKLDGIINKSNIIKDYIEKIEDKDVRQMLEQQFKENI